MSLTLTTQPGFTEIADATFAAGNPVTDSAMIALNDAAKFAVVRNEQFYGYYASGDTVVLPVSPADGYAYSRAELLYSWSLYATYPPLGPCAGRMTPPPMGSTSGQGTLLYWSGGVDPATGLVSLNTAYYKSSQQNTGDGILFVVTQAQRQR
jgi:hypothetical protein